MHAVVARVTVSDPEGGERVLREEVVPAVSQLPGFQTGYWTRSGNSGLSMVVLESEDVANQLRDRMRSEAPEGVTIEEVEVREVVAHA
jgi:hypothetical protein